MPDTQSQLRAAHPGEILGAKSQTLRILVSPRGTNYLPLLHAAQPGAGSVVVLFIVGEHRKPFVPPCRHNRPLVVLSGLAGERSPNTFTSASQKLCPQPPTFSRWLRLAQQCSLGTAVMPSSPGTGAVRCCSLPALSLGLSGRGEGLPRAQGPSSRN